MKPGTSELNSPSRAKAAKAATPAAMNSPRPRSGMPSPAKRRAGRVRCAPSRGRAAGQGRHGQDGQVHLEHQRRGVGRVLGEQPGGQRAEAEARPCWRRWPPATPGARAEAGASSVSVAVAVPVIRPADRPDTIRAAISAPTSGARMNTTVLSALAPSARPAPACVRPGRRSARPAARSRSPPRRRRRRSPSPWPRRNASGPGR